jgi:diamine N-acetyltransferase
MVRLKQATADDWQTIRAIAYGTWPHTFGEMIPKDQISYMLERIYSEASLRTQMDQLEHHFLLAEKDDEALGFISYEFDHHNKPDLMIHKLYLLPEAQGMGVGKMILDHLTAKARDQNQAMLRLKVFYKNDKARGFYERYGFEIAGTETSDAGNGYIILDNVMCKQI